MIRVGDLVRCCEYYGGLVGLVTVIEPTSNPTHRWITVQGEWEVQCFDIEVEVISENR